MMAKPSLIDAIHTIFTLQRWNFLPRAETWVEAENVAFAAHLGYVVGKTANFTQDDLLGYFGRCLLAPFLKQSLSDVSYRVRKALAVASKKPDAWDKLRMKRVSGTASMFPASVSERVSGYLKANRKVGVDSDRVGALIDCVQALLAQRECERNSRMYEEFYQPYLAAFKEKLDNLEKDPTACQLLRAHALLLGSSAAVPDGRQFADYYSVIRCLKEIRRWNRINRTVETSVLSHTFLVALFALLFSWMGEDEARNGPEPDGFEYRAVLLALFHDVPEALTGDIISPVKDTVKNEFGTDFQEVEKNLIGAELLPLLESAPSVCSEVEGLKLWEDLEGRPFSVGSLVKACDRLALVVECLFELRAAGRLRGEMAGAYADYLETLQNSEWPQVREFCARLSVQYPASNS